MVAIKIIKDLNLHSIRQKLQNQGRKKIPKRKEEVFTDHIE